VNKCLVPFPNQAPFNPLSLEDLRDNQIFVIGSSPVSIQYLNAVPNFHVPQCELNFIERWILSIRYSAHRIFRQGCKANFIHMNVFRVHSYLLSWLGFESEIADDVKFFVRDFSVDSFMYRMMKQFCSVREHQLANLFPPTVSTPIEVQGLWETVSTPFSDVAQLIRSWKQVGQNLEQASTPVASAVNAGRQAIEGLRTGYQEILGERRDRFYAVLMSKLALLEHLMDTPQAKASFAVDFLRELFDLSAAHVCIAEMAIKALMYSSQQPTIEVQGPLDLTGPAEQFVRLFDSVIGFKSFMSPLKCVDLVKEFTRILQPFAKFGSAMITLQKLVKILLELFTFCDMWLQRHCDFYATIRSGGAQSDLLELNRCVVTYQDQHVRDDLLLSHEMREEFLRKYPPLYEKLSDQFATAKNLPGSSYFNRISSEFSKLFSEVTKRHAKEPLSARRVPFSVCLAGDPGVGKTVLITRIVASLRSADVYSVPGNAKIDKDSDIWQANASDKYCTGYCGQWGVVFDDLGQFESSDPSDSQYARFFDMVNSAEYLPPMAELADKGRTFRSELVISTSNAAYPSIKLLEMQAFLRRRHQLIKVVKYPEATASWDTYFQILDPRDTDGVNRPLKEFKQQYGPNAHQRNVQDLMDYLVRAFAKHQDEQEALRRAALDRTSILKDLRPETQDFIRQRRQNNGVDIPTCLEVESQQSRIAPENVGLWSALVSSEIACATRERYSQAVLFLKSKFPEVSYSRISAVAERFASVCLATLWEWHEKLGSYLTSTTEYLNDLVQWAVVNAPYLLGIGAIVSALAMISWWRNGRDQEPVDESTLIQAYSQQTSSAPKPQVVLQQYAPTTAASAPKPQVVLQQYAPSTASAAKPAVVLQSSIQSEQILNQIQKNLCLLMLKVPTQTSDGQILMQNRVARGLFVCEDVVLTNRHYLLNLDGSPTMTIVARSQHVGEPTWVSFTSTFDLVRDVAVISSDAVLIRTGTVKRTSLVDKFFTVDDHSRYQLDSATLVRMKPEPGNVISIVQECFQMRQKDVSLSNCEFNGNLIHVLNAYGYPASTVKGDCGSVLFSNSSLSSRCIMGIHVAYIGGEIKMGYSLPLSQEKVVDGLKRLGVTPLLRRLPSLQVIPLSPEVQADLVMKVVGADGTVSQKQIAADVVGEVLLPYSPGKHVDRRSALYVSEPTDPWYTGTDLSALSARDARIAIPYELRPTNLIHWTLEKYCRPIRYHSDRALQFAKTMLSSQLDKFVVPKSTGKRIFSVEEVLSGVWEADGKTRCPYTNKVNVDSATGFGYTETKKGELLEDVDGRQETYRIKSPQLKANLERLEQQMRGSAERDPVIHTACLKSEPRSLEKIQSGNTREFVFPPTEMYILCGRAFGAFSAAMKASHATSFAALGVDVHGPVWTTLMKRMSRHGGNNCLDMDFTNFDGQCVTDQLQMAAIECINDWYGKDPEWDTIRNNCAEEMIHTYILNGKILYQKHTGNPSGSAITTEMNCCVNYLAWCCVFYQILADEGVSNRVCELFEQTDFACYGDDNILTVSDEVAQFITTEKIAAYYDMYKMTVTPASKSGKLSWKRAEELQFLKRNWKPDPAVPGVYMAPLEKKSILRMPQFVKKGNSDREAILELTNGLFLECYYHGRDFYNEFRKEFLRRCREKLATYDMEFEKAIRRYEYFFLERQEKFLPTNRSEARYLEDLMSGRAPGTELGKLSTFSDEDSAELEQFCAALLSSNLR